MAKKDKILNLDNEEKELLNDMKIAIRENTGKSKTGESFDYKSYHFDSDLLNKRNLKNGGFLTANQWAKEYSKLYPWSDDLSQQRRKDIARGFAKALAHEVYEEGDRSLLYKIEQFKSGESPKGYGIKPEALEGLRDDILAQLVKGPLYDLVNMGINQALDELEKKVDSDTNS